MMTPMARSARRFEQRYQHARDSRKLAMITILAGSVFLQLYTATASYMLLSNVGSVLNLVSVTLNMIFSPCQNLA